MEKTKKTATKKEQSAKPENKPLMIGQLAAADALNLHLHENEKEIYSLKPEPENAHKIIRIALPVLRLIAAVYPGAKIRKVISKLVAVLEVAFPEPEMMIEQEGL